jgi:hypothetical protein
VLWQKNNKINKKTKKNKKKKRKTTGNSSMSTIPSVCVGNDAVDGFPAGRGSSQIEFQVAQPVTLAGIARLQGPSGLVFVLQIGAVHPIG